MRYFSASALALAVVLTSTASQASVVGVFHENLNNGPNTVFIFGAAGTSGTITGGGGLNDVFSIDGTGVFTYLFGNAGREMTSNGTVNSLSYRIDSAKPISALALNRANASTDMTTLLDVDGLGNEYYVMTTPGTFGDGAQMSVTATEDNTLVTIKSPVAIAGNAANAPFQVTLQAGESVFYESGNGGDLTGTHVVADKNVAVFGGAECPQVPNGTTFCDHVIAQHFSVDNFDNNFRIVKSTTARTGVGDVVRVIASQDGTEVFLNGASKGTINAGEFIQILGAEEGALTSTKPVMVGQFLSGQFGAIGDPAFAMLPSVDQQLKSYAFATPVGADVFVQNWLNIAIKDLFSNTLKLNGAAVDTSGFTNIAGTLFGNIAILPGFGVIEASDTFLATISGYSPFDSYYSPIATKFSPGVSPPPDPTPVVPLPAAGWLMIAGFGGLAAAKRRSKT